MGTGRILARYGALTLAALTFPVLACRKGDGNESGELAAIATSADGNQGCNVLATPPMGPFGLWSDPRIGTATHIVARSGSMRVVLTGADASVFELDFEQSPPTETVLATAAEIEAVLPPGTVAELSGIAIVDDFGLAVIENATNTVIGIGLASVFVLAGAPDPDGGFAPSTGPGFLDGVRFDFSAPTQLIGSGGGQVFVTDRGNHAIRSIIPGVVPLTDTLVGTGAPGSADGPLATSSLDTPTSLTVLCGGELAAAETGGNTLRVIGIGTEDFFGQLQGDTRFLAGDGVSETVQGVDTAARLAAPTALVSTAGGELFWVDSATGILRRYSFATGESDCPLFADCASAVAAGGNFTPGGGFSAAIVDGIGLVVVDGLAGTIFSIGVDGSPSAPQ